MGWGLWDIATCCCGTPTVPCHGCDLPAKDLTLTYYPGGGFTATLVYNATLHSWAGSGVIPVSGATVTWHMACDNRVSPPEPSGILITESTAGNPLVFSNDCVANPGGPCLDESGFTCSPFFISLTQHSTGTHIADISE